MDSQVVGEGLVLEAFSEAEYRRRHRALLAHAHAAGCAGLLVTSPQHLVYVAGDPTGFQRTGVQLGLSAVLLAERDSTFVVRRYEADSARTASPIARVTDYMGDVERPIEVIARELHEMGLAGGRVGAALDRWGLTPRDQADLRRLVPGLDLVDLSAEVDAVADRKSGEELEVMRRCMRVTELGVDAFRHGARPGASEAEIAAAILAAMTAAGSEPPFYHPFVLSGEHAALPHGVWSARTVQPDEPVFLEVSAALRHYHAPLVRTVLAGRDPEIERVHAVACEALQAAVDAIGPGALTGEVDRAARAVVERAGLGEGFRHRTGYSVGIDWVTRGATSLAPGGQEELLPGMTFHLPLNLFVSGRFCVGASNTVAVTEDGSEPLGDAPLGLTA
jgi:Xaa-Pro dipeptidase